jgi:hypothetical protein
MVTNSKASLNLSQWPPALLDCARSLRRLLGGPERTTGMSVLHGAVGASALAKIVDEPPVYPPWF